MPPVATSQDTIEALLESSKRKSRRVPIRRAFVQQGSQAKPGPGVLAELVRRHDDRALDLYLLVLALASAEHEDHGWSVRKPAQVWARAADLRGQDATGAVSKVWRRLSDHKLLTRERVRREAQLTVLREDGSGAPYTHAGARKEAHFQLPFAYWTDAGMWHRKLDLPSKALLLIALSLRDDFYLPYERARDWYGLSAETAERGLEGLRGHGLLAREAREKVAPLAPKGYTVDLRYTLRPPFGPLGTVHRSGRG